LGGNFLLHEFFRECFAVSFIPKTCCLRAHGGGVGAGRCELPFDASVEVDVGERDALLQKGKYCLCGELCGAADDDAGHTLKRYAAGSAVTVFDDETSALFFGFAAVLQ